MENICDECYLKDDCNKLELILLISKIHDIELTINKCDEFDQ